MNTSPSRTEPSHKRWYDHDPLLIEVLELLRSYPTELRTQAASFIEKLESTIGKDMVDKVYAEVLGVRGQHSGKRWYDNDLTISKAVEVLRVIPQESQREAAQRFLSALKEPPAEKDNTAFSEMTFN